MSRPSFRGFAGNWSNTDLPLHEKIRLAAKNNMIKVLNRSDCCGNHGEPGC